MRALSTLVIASATDVVGNEHITAVVVLVRAWVLAAAAIQVLLAHFFAILGPSARFGTCWARRQVVPMWAGTCVMLVSALPLGILR